MKTSKEKESKNRIETSDRLKTSLILIAFFSLALPSITWAQLPLVKLVDKTNGTPSEPVALTGFNFGTDPTKVTVYFGGAKAAVTSVSDQLLETTVPFGSSFDKISVTNTTSGLTGYTREQFLMSYGGFHGFNTLNLQGQFDFFAESGLYDHCICDFDGDNKMDMAAANDNSTFISLFKNNSTIGTLTFTKSTGGVGVRSIHVRCGDLNGDGLPDLAVSEGGGGTRIFVFTNLGSFTFSMQTITLTGKKTKRIEIADLDGDGKPELIITDQGGSDVVVLVNQSTLAAISFAAPVIVPVAGAASTDGIAVEDLDGDYLPEIITSQFLSATGNVFIIKNESTPGNLRLTNQITLPLSGTIVNIKVGDLDGDRKPDIAVTQLLASGISVFLNTSTASQIQFATPQNILTDVQPWGIDMGDLDGDRKPDIVVASITQKSLTVLNNSSTAGNLSFQKTIVPTTFINRHVKIVDMDGDAKPDITFTSVDDNNLSIPASKISIFRNAACLAPLISPAGPLTLCSGFTQRLQATVNGGVTYDWKKGGVTVVSGANPYLDVAASGQYSVAATAEGGGCTSISNAVDVTVTASAALGPAVPANDGPVCKNGTLQLSVADVGASAYQWTGPAGYTGSGLLPSPVTNFTLANAGRYSLDVINGSCLDQQVSTIVEAIDIPDFKVSVPGPGLICQGQNITLSLSPTGGSYTYQWFEKTSGLIAGETNSSLVVSTSGAYYAQLQSITFPACSAVKSDTAAILVASIPVALFTAPPTSCAGQPVQFTNQSTVDPAAATSYAWAFGDGNTSTSTSPAHAYNTINSFNVQLTVTYQGGLCPQTFSRTVSVQSPPVLSIATPANQTTLCEGSTLALQAVGSFVSYLWSSGETTSSIVISTDGTYSVAATAANSCIVNASLAISLLSAPVITISATPVQVNAGESSQLLASGLLDYAWTPGITLSDSTLANPLATPVQSTYYNVSGEGSNGCDGKDSIQVVVKGEAIVNKLKPANFFSPANGDLINNTWMVQQIESFPQCGVSIYDEKGIKVFEAKPYLNNWEGTFNGKALPMGVYYYIIRCDGEENIPKTGSITLLK